MREKRPVINVLQDAMYCTQIRSAVRKEFRQALGLLRFTESMHYY